MATKRADQHLDRSLPPFLHVSHDCTQASLPHLPPHHNIGTTKKEISATLKLCIGRDE